jgi:AraC family transcriptional regulator
MEEPLKKNSSMDVNQTNLHGNSLKSCQIAGVRFTETVYPPGLILLKHSHRHAYFCMVLQGHYTESCGMKSLTCGPLTLLFRTQGEAHSDHFHSAGSRCFIIEIEPHFFERVCEYPLVMETAEFRGGLPAWLTMRLYREFRRMDQLSPLAMEALALEMVVETSRHHSRMLGRIPRRWLEQAKEIIHERFSESLIITEIAASVGVHPVHLAREFRRSYHCTVGEYIRKLRIEFACRQLFESDTPLVEIAVAAGFSDHSHFSRTFKQLIGMTPAEYRKAVRPR